MLFRSPPLRHPCYFGIDIPQEGELIAAGRSIQEIADYIGVDSLGYLSLAGLGRAIKTAEAKNDISVSDEEALKFLNQEFCYGCMETQGWPFDPIEGARHGAQHATFFPRSTVGMRREQVPSLQAPVREGVRGT